MKRFFIIAFCIVLTINMISCGGKDNKVDIKFLTQNVFEIPTTDFLLTLKFKEDKTYTLEFSAPEALGAPYFVIGEYEIKDKTILVHPKKCLDAPNGKPIDCNHTLGEGECTIMDSEYKMEIGYEASVIYTKHLIYKLKNKSDKETNQQIFGVKGFEKK